MPRVQASGEPRGAGTTIQTEEAILRTAPYAGFPTAVTTTNIFKGVVAEKTDHE